MSYRQPHHKDSNVSLPPISQIFSLPSQNPESSLSLAPLRNTPERKHYNYQDQNNYYHRQSSITPNYGQGNPAVQQPYPPQHLYPSLPSVPGGRNGMSYSGPSPPGPVGGVYTYPVPMEYPTSAPKMNQPVSRSASAHDTAEDLSRGKYECNYCGKGFLRPSALKIHVISHTGEKDFVCPDERCRRKFGIRSNLIRHIRLVHQQQSGEVLEE